MAAYQGPPQSTRSTRPAWLQSPRMSGRVASHRCPLERTSCPNEGGAGETEAAALAAAWAARAAAAAAVAATPANGAVSWGWEGSELAHLADPRFTTEPTPSAVSAHSHQ